MNYIGLDIETQGILIKMNLNKGDTLCNEKEFVIQNKVGLHARPAAVLVQTANKFKSDITVEKDGKVVSAKAYSAYFRLEQKKVLLLRWRQMVPTKKRQ